MSLFSATSDHLENKSAFSSDEDISMGHPDVSSHTDEQSGSLPDHGMSGYSKGTFTEKTEVTRSTTYSCSERSAHLASARNPSLRQRQQWTERIRLCGLSEDVEEIGRRLGMASRHVLEMASRHYPAQYVLSRRRRRTRQSGQQQTQQRPSPSSWFGKCFEPWNVVDDVQGVVGDVMYDDVQEDYGGNGRCRFGWGFFSFNNLLRRYLMWTFRASVLGTVFSFAIIYWIFIFIFAAILYGLGKSDLSPCIGGVDDFEEQGTFLDAFILSWTTFATVGYGVTYPIVSGPDIRPHECSFILAISSLEAFCGLLFGSICATIIFAKLSRLLSFAQVIFSDNIVIRYGAQEGNLAENSDRDDMEHGHETFVKLQEESSTNPTALDIELPLGDHNDLPASTEPSGSSTPSKAFNSRALLAQQSTYESDDERLPCPVLEFQIVNRLAHVHGGEIIDAKVNIVASLDGDQANDFQKGRARKRKRRKKVPNSYPGHPIPYDPWKSPGGRMMRRESMTTRFVGLSNRQAQSLENWTGNPVPWRVFCPLKVETDEHPFLKRVWTIRHRLDEESPLLRQSAREMVRANGGFWPLELNTAEAVRNSIHFDQILVNINGTSNADANSVYSQHLYEWGDIYVGYRFINILYHDVNSGHLEVNHKLIGKVAPQFGGGAEPLSTRPVSRGSQLDDMIIL